MTLKSCIYQGNVRHRRNMPTHHQFDFKSFMLLLDLDELDVVFKHHWLWSTTRFSFARFKQSEFIRKFPDQTNLRRRVELVLEELGFDLPIGRVRLLTQCRYLGFAMNPVSFYYCYAKCDQAPERIVAIIAEVNNTPWGEQHHYLIQADPDGLAESKTIVPSESFTACDQNTDSEESCNSRRSIGAQNIEKTFHVSPFMSMQMSYRMAFTPPGDQVAVKIENQLHAPAELPQNQDADSPAQSNKILDVSMLMKRKPITGWNLTLILIKYPLISFKIWAGIYWHALRLYFKKVPFYSHPKNSHPKNSHPKNSHPKNPHPKNQNSIELPPQILSEQAANVKANSLDASPAREPDSETVLVN